MKSQKSKREIKLLFNLILSILLALICICIGVFAFKYVVPFRCTVCEQDNVKILKMVSFKYVLVFSLVISAVLVILVNYLLIRFNHKRDLATDGHEMKRSRIGKVLAMDALYSIIVGLLVSVLLNVFVLIPYRKNKLEKVYYDYQFAYADAEAITCFVDPKPDWFHDQQINCLVVLDQVKEENNSLKIVPISLKSLSICFPGEFLVGLIYLYCFTPKSDQIKW